MKPIEIKNQEMFLLPPAKHLCQECATQHEDNLPHNQQSMYYQTKFNMEHKRAPTWQDAMAHCTDEIKKAWTAALMDHGIVI